MPATIYTVCIIPTSLTCLLLFISLYSWLSSSRLFQPNGSGWVILKTGEGLKCCWALGRARCELHTSHQRQQQLLLWLSALCAWPVHCSRPSKSAPPERCFQNLIQHARSVGHLTASQTHLTFLAISICLVLLPFKNLFPHLCRCTNISAYTSGNIGRQMYSTTESWEKYVPRDRTSCLGRASNRRCQKSKHLNQRKIIEEVRSHHCALTFKVSYNVSPSIIPPTEDALRGARNIMWWERKCVFSDETLFLLKRYVKWCHMPFCKSFSWKSSGNAAIMYPH